MGGGNNLSGSIGVVKIFVNYVANYEELKPLLFLCSNMLLEVCPTFLYLFYIDIYISGVSLFQPSLANYPIVYNSLPQGKKVGKTK